jgi:hypothetical protein
VEIAVSGLKAVDVDLESPSFGPAWSAVDSHDIVQEMGADEGSSALEDMGAVIAGKGK